MVYIVLVLLRFFLQKDKHGRVGVVGHHFMKLLINDGFLYYIIFENLPFSVPASGEDVWGAF